MIKINTQNEWKYFERTLSIDEFLVYLTHIEMGNNLSWLDIKYEVWEKASFDISKFIIWTKSSVFKYLINKEL